jgi:hypothetical protein
MQERETVAERRPVGGAKEPYSTPTITDYGSVGEVTRGDVGAATDLPPNNNLDTCNPPIPVPECQGIPSS